MFIKSLALENEKVRKRLAQTYNYQPFRLWYVNKPYIMISDLETAKVFFALKSLLLFYLSCKIIIIPDDFIAIKTHGQGRKL